MTGIVESFFAGLADLGHVATWEREFATIRFDIPDADDVDGELEADAGQHHHPDRLERWYVTISDGTVSATRQDRPADAVVRVSRPRFEAMVRGELNAQAAFLRGLLTVEGKVAALVLFQRCLPGPAGSKGRVAPIPAATVTAQRRDT